MRDSQLTLTSQRLKTPRAAAIAGIVFGVLFSTSLVLIRRPQTGCPAHKHHRATHPGLEQLTGPNS